jgi:hypothetical protein
MAEKKPVLSKRGLGTPAALAALRILLMPEPTFLAISGFPHKEIMG